MTAEERISAERDLIAAIREAKEVIRMLRG